MRFAACTILIAILSAGAAIMMPWWIIAVVAFAVTFVVNISSGKAFLSGFCGIALFWLVAILLADAANEHILSARMAKLFSLPHYGVFIVVNLLVGGLVGGLAGWSGAVLRNGFMKPQSQV
ncbi:MAG: hypothetical protein JNL72_08555 [Flavipsychrobacter sp.]|nr:hypothetical protein [Flavipsychrobacter sp.]